MLAIGSPSSVRTTSTCNALLRELQQIWIDIGESEADKDRMLLDLERECLEVYRRKVDEAANAKARLHQSVAAKEAELATLMAALGDINIYSPVKINSEKKASSLKEQLTFVTPLVEDLKVKKEERMKQFADIKLQIDRISGEISGYGQFVDAMSSLNVGEQDLSQRKLTEYQTHLRTLQKEKSERLHKVLEYVNEVHSLCSVLGLDFGKTVSDVHPSLHGTSMEQSTNISNNTLEGLEHAILKLKTEKKVRFQKLKDIVASLFELWTLMDSTNEEKGYFSRVNSFLGSSESEIVEPSALSMDIIQQDQKKLQDLLLTEKESIYGSKPSPRRSSSSRKPNGYGANGNGSLTPTPGRNSVGSPTAELKIPRSYSGRTEWVFQGNEKVVYNTTQLCGKCKGRYHIFFICLWF